jgi:hypothetical protein
LRAKTRRKKRTQRKKNEFRGIRAKDRAIRSPLAVSHLEFFACLNSFAALRETGFAFKL